MRTERTERLRGSLRDSDGTTRQVPHAEDKAASRLLLRRRQAGEDAAKALRIDRKAKERLRPLAEHLKGCESHLRSKANTALYVALTARRIRAIPDATKAKAVADLDAG